MPLPGKLTVGLLEEDNPVKAYFRIRPVAQLDGEGHYPLEAMDEKFPEDGWIRIVPDKNELASFKNRMRDLGRYCALDLRRFPGENEKIRPNKNYGGASERNASIVYSDVIGPVPCQVAAQVLDAQYVFAGEEITLRDNPPGTRYVLVRREGQLLGPWIWGEARDVAGCVSLRHAPGLPFQTLPEAQAAPYCLTLETQEGPVVLMTRPQMFGIPSQQEEGEESPFPVVGQEDQESTALLRALFAAQENQNSQAAVPGQAAKAGEGAKPAETAKVKQPAQSGDIPGAAGAAAPGEALNAGDEPQTAKAAQPEQGPAPIDEPGHGEAADETSKSWEGLGAVKEVKGRQGSSWEETCVPHQQAGPKLKAVSRRLSLRDQALQAQSGINPRRGRSLSEVIDEQWRRSRYEQLGHPVPPEATSKPAVSPIEQAVQGVRAAWSIQEARGALLAALLKEEGLRQGLMEALKIQAEAQKSAADKRMEQIEAERLKLLGEIDGLRQRRGDVKAQLMEELRQAHRKELEELTGRSQALRQEIARNEAAAATAGEAARAAQAALTQSSQQLLQAALAQAAVQRAAQCALDGTLEQPLSPPALCQPTPGELVSALRVSLAGAGFALDNPQAVDLLLCLLTGGLMVVSGPTGSGKTQLVRQLARALGLNRENGRFLQLQRPPYSRAQALLERMDPKAPAILLLDDANLPAAADAVEQAICLQDMARDKGVPLWVALTVQDGPEGLPLPPRLLSRAFLLRLKAPAADQPWKPAALEQGPVKETVALPALTQLLDRTGHLPGAVEDRLARLRQALDQVGYRLDRRTLDEIWLFCGGLIRTGRMEDMDALDAALRQRALPAMLATMELEQLIKLPHLLQDMPRCLELMEQPLPLPAL